MANAAPLPIRLGALLRRHRGNQRQADIAAAVGIAINSLSDFELGKCTPSVPVFLALIRALQIDLAEITALLEDNDPEPANGKAA